MNTNLFRKAFVYKAEAKNVRLMNSKDVNFDKKLSDVLSTIKALAEVTPANPHITIGDTVYDTDKYLVPKSVLVLINSYQIYVNTNCAFMDPVIIGEIESTGEVLEPAEFNAFFMMWNSNQYNDKLELVPVDLKICTLMDVGAVCSGVGLVRINDQAYVNEFAALALNLQCGLFNEKNCVADTIVSDMEVSEWLLSN